MIRERLMNKTKTQGVSCLAASSRRIRYALARSLYAGYCEGDPGVCDVGRCSCRFEVAAIRTSIPTRVLRYFPLLSAFLDNQLHVTNCTTYDAAVRVSLKWVSSSRWRCINSCATSISSSTSDLKSTSSSVSSITFLLYVTFANTISRSQWQ